MECKGKELKLNLQQFGGRGASSSRTNKGLNLTAKQIQAGNRLNENAERGVANDIKQYLNNKNEYEGTQSEFINDLSKEWGIDKNVVKNIFSIERYRSQGVQILDKVPKGYIKLEGATTAPKGYTWYFNGKSRFTKEYKNALVKNKR